MPALRLDYPLDGYHQMEGWRALVPPFHVVVWILVPWWEKGALTKPFVCTTIMMHLKTRSKIAGHKAAQYCLRRLVEEEQERSQSSRFYTPQTCRHFNNNRNWSRNPKPEEPIMLSLSSRAPVLPKVIGEMHRR